MKVGEEMGRRWFSVWGGFYRDSVARLATSPHTRTLVAESARSVHSASHELMVARHVTEDFIFEFDGVSESVGPRYVRLPNAAWATDLPPLVAVTPRGSGNSEMKEHVVVRVEAGLLSATLVGLTHKPPTDYDGEYDLEFLDSRDTVRLFARSTT